jgi:hypothetical protein
VNCTSVALVRERSNPMSASAFRPPGCRDLRSVLRDGFLVALVQVDQPVHCEAGPSPAALGPAQAPMRFRKNRGGPRPRAAVPDAKDGP